MPWNAQTKCFAGAKLEVVGGSGICRDDIHTPNLFSASSISRGGPSGGTWAEEDDWSGQQRPCGRYLYDLGIDHAYHTRQKPESCASQQRSLILARQGSNEEAAADYLGGFCSPTGGTPAIASSQDRIFRLRDPRRPGTDRHRSGLESQELPSRGTLLFLLIEGFSTVRSAANGEEPIQALPRLSPYL